MALSKLPPISKVYEALSAVADNRVFLYETEAYVISSDHSKVYTVRFQDMVYSSNDRATSWQHYPGYPIIAVLISQDMLEVDKRKLCYFKNVNWNQLNKKYRNDYQKAIEEYLETIKEQGVNIEELKIFVQNILSKLGEQDLVIKGNSQRLLKPEDINK